MPEPEVQQLPGGGCLTSYSFCTCPLYFAWVFLSYPMPSHFIGILSLGPCILFYFFRGSTPLLATAGGNHDERLSFQSFHHSNFGCVFVTLYLFGFRTHAWQKTGFIAQRPTRVEVFTGAIRQEIPRYVRVNPRCESFRLGYHVGLMKHHL